MSGPTLAALREAYARRNPRSLARHVVTVAESGHAPAWHAIPFPLVMQSDATGRLRSLDGDEYRPGPPEGDAAAILRRLAAGICPADAPTTR